MIEQIDNFIQDAGPERMSAGSGPGAAQAINAARESHRRYRKVELLEDAIERVANRRQGGNEERLMRDEMRRLLENNRTRRAFTPEERSALERFVRGTPMDEALRLVSRASPLRGTLSALFAFGGPIVSQPLAVIPAAGLAADVSYSAMRRQAQRELMEQLGLTPDEMALLRAQRAGRAAPARAVGGVGAAVGGYGAGRVAPE